MPADPDGKLFASYGKQYHLRGQPLAHYGQEYHLHPLPASADVGSLPTPIRNHRFIAARHQTLAVQHRYQPRHENSLPLPPAYAPPPLTPSTDSSQPAFVTDDLGFRFQEQQRNRQLQSHSASRHASHPPSAHSHTYMSFRAMSSSSKRWPNVPIPSITEKIDDVRQRAREDSEWLADKADFAKEYLKKKYNWLKKLPKQDNLRRHTKKSMVPDNGVEKTVAGPHGSYLVQADYILKLGGGG